MNNKSKVDPILELWIKQRKVFTKYDVMAAIKCDERTAQRRINKKRESSELVIVKWVKSGDQDLACFGVGDSDVPCPKLTKSERRKRWMKRPDVRERMRQSCQRWRAREKFKRVSAEAANDSFINQLLKLNGVK